VQARDYAITDPVVFKVPLLKKRPSPEHLIAGII